MRIRSPNLLFNTFILLLLLAAPTNQMAIMRSWLFGSSETTNYHPAILDSPRRHSPSAFLDETHNPHLQAIINEAKLNEAELDQQHQTAVTAQSNQVNHLDHIDSDEKAMEALMLWFSIHDLDSNGFLDGHELLKVFAEWAVQDGGIKQFDSVGGNLAQSYGKSLARMTELVDHVLIEDDANGDGYIDVEEFLNSHDL